MSTLSPTLSSPIEFRRPAASFTGLPLIAVTTSPALSPAFSAADSSITCETSAPWIWPSSMLAAMSGVSVCTLTPSTPRFTSPNLTSWFITVFIMLDGMAKPMPMLPPVRDRIALLMPTSWPDRSTSAPPELPGLIDASVWMKSS